MSESDDFHMSKNDDQSDYYDDSEIDVNSEYDYQDDFVYKPQEKPILYDQQISDLDTDYFYKTGNINYKYELEKAFLKGNNEGYFAIVRQDTKYKYWKRVMAIKNINYLRFLGDKFLESGGSSFHQIIHREQNLKFYFDIDWKGIQDINTIQLQDFFEQLIMQQFRAFGVYSNQYVLDWQFNYLIDPNYESGDADISTGCHLVVSGVKSNLSVIRFFALKLSEMTRDTKYDGLLDLQVYNLGHTLRYEGYKFEDIPKEQRTDFENKRIKNVYSKPKDYSLVMITYTHSSDLFVKVPLIYQDEFKQSLENRKQTSMSAPIEKLEYYDNLIQEYAKNNKFEFSLLKDGKFKKLTYSDHICPCCGVHHDSNNSLYLIVLDNGNIYLNCFRNVKSTGRKLKPYLCIFKNEGPRAKLQNLIKSDIGKFTETTQELTQAYIEAASTIKHSDLIPTQSEIVNGNRSNNDIKITESQLYDFFVNRKDLYLSSHLGTGKSKLIHKIINDNRCHGSKIALSSKCLYSADFASKFEFELYSDTKKPITVTSKTELVIQLESIIRLDMSHQKIQYVIIDELVSFISHLQQSDLVDRHIYGLLVQIIQNAGQMIIGDAHLDKWYIDLIHDIRNSNNINNLRRIQDPIVLYNEYKPCKHIKANVILGIPKQQKLIQQIVQQILLLIKLGIKTVLHTTRKGLGKQIFDALDKEIPNQVIFIAGSKSNDITDWNDPSVNRTHLQYKEWLFNNLSIVNEKQVFIHTQTLTFGVSFENSPEYKQYIGIIDWQTSNGAQEVCQSLFRFRNIQNIKLYLTKECKGQNKYTTYQEALDYVNAFNYKGFVLPSIDNKVFFLQLSALVAISKQQIKPNVKLMSYMLDLGISIDSVSLEIDELGTIAPSNENPQNTNDLMTVNDIYNYQDDTIKDVTDFESFRNKKHTYYNVLRYRLFQPEIQFDDYPELYVQLLNKHIQEFCETYNKLEKMEKGIFKKIHTSDEKITQMYQYLENVLDEKEKFYSAGIHPIDFVRDFKELNELKQLTPLIKLIEQDRSLTFNTDIVDICSKIGEFDKKLKYDMKQNQTTAIIKFVENNTPFKAFKLIDDHTKEQHDVIEPVQIKSKLIDLSLDNIFFGISPLFAQTKVKYYKQLNITIGVKKTPSYNELKTIKAGDYQKDHKDETKLRVQKCRLSKKK